MTASGAGMGAPLEGEEWKATRLVNTRVTLRRMIGTCVSFFIGVFLHMYSPSAFLQEN
jgi:hypothetical protein